MSESPVILLYGHDPVLLMTRRLILERSGFEVWSALDLKEVEIITGSQNIDILITCHTVSRKDQTAALAIAQILNSHIINFALAEMFPAHGGDVSGKDFNSFISTATFISAVEEVVRQHSIVLRAMKQVGLISKGSDE